ncbi:MAG TPA: peptidoglycan-binding domain-containing protein, partial [Vicinamibacteria bacterium]
GRSLSRTTLRTHLEQLRALDLPAVLEVFHPSRRDTCFVALLRLDAGTGTVAVGDLPQIEAPLSQLDALWTRDAVVWWPEAPDVGRDPARGAAWAREVLAGLGYAEPDLAAAVSRFQRAAGLVPDGVPGPRTRMALFALSSGTRPRMAADGARP